MILTPDEYHSKWLFVRDFIYQFCIYRVQPGEPLLKGKDPNTWNARQFYLRRGLFNAEFLATVSELFLQKIYEEIQTFDFQIAGLETASTPLLAGIPLIAAKHGVDINAFSIRKTRKEYGLLNWIEGRVNDKPIMLVDDLCGSTASLNTAYNTLIKVNLTNILNLAFCVVSKNTSLEDRKKLTENSYLPEDVRVSYLYSLRDFGLTSDMKV